MASKLKKKVISFESTTWFRVLLLAVSSALTVLVLTFSILTLLKLRDGDISMAPKYMVWVFICLGLTRIITFLRERSKLSFIRSLVLFTFDVSLGIIVIFAKYDLYIFSIVGGIYALSIIVSRVFRIIQRHRIRDIVFNSILIALAIFLSIALFQKVNIKDIPSIVLIECLVIAGTAFVEVAVMAFSQLKLRVLLKIIVKTYALEILFGLLTLMVSFSLVLMVYEPKMANFPDALWYCFAVVTTIGFGDFAAVTAIGRVITVVLGMYGIIVVAVITSIIVNFYNETKGKDDVKEIKNINDSIEEEKQKRKKPSK